jgi:ABC-type transport system substrate-binding protein
MKRFLLFFLVVSVVLWSTTGLGFSQEAKPGGTLIFGSAGDAARLDPADVTDGISITRTDAMFEGLLRYKEGSTEIRVHYRSSFGSRCDRRHFHYPDRCHVRRVAPLQRRQYRN